MNDFKRIVINNIESVLPYYLIQKNIITIQNNIPDAIIDEFDAGLEKRDKKRNNEIKTLKSYEPDAKLGDLGEEYIESLLISQASITNKVSNIERISKTRTNYFPGYDIEVKLKDNTIIGVEVKSTRVASGNIIHITNNEIRAAAKMGDNYYLVIVVYSDKSEIVKQVYKLKNPISFLELEDKDLEKLVEIKQTGKAEFYPQQYTLKIEKSLLSNNKLYEDAHIL